MNKKNKKLNINQKHVMLETITLRFMKAIILSTDVPPCLSIKVLVFSKIGPNIWESIEPFENY